MCVGCPGWNGCCSRVWGNCFGCARWNGCCHRVTDPACVAANAACQAIRGTALAALVVARRTLDGASFSLVAARGVLSHAQLVVDKSRVTLDAAKTVLESVKQTVQAGADAASAITRLTLGGLINIHKIEFKVTIALAATGRFSGSMDASLLRVFKKFSFNLNLNSLDFPGITSGRKRRSALEEASRDIDPMRLHHHQEQVDNDHYADDVEQLLEHERSVHEVEQKQIQREASKLKAAANRTDYIPQQNVHLDVDDLQAE